jgi:DNA-binding NarL/FixJ family response regulator
LVADGLQLQLGVKAILVAAGGHFKLACGGAPEWFLNLRHALPIIGHRMNTTRPAPALHTFGTPNMASANTRFVLFVGEALRPDATALAELARDGIRCLWRAGSEQALRTAALARFDAVCLDTGALDGTSAWPVARLREAHACPVLVVGDGRDPVEELQALENGADLFLARPLPTRRLCAHLLALLRRPHLPGVWPNAATAAPEVVARRRTPPSAASPLLIEQLLRALGDGGAASASMPTELQPEGIEVHISGLRFRLR